MSWNCHHGRVRSGTRAYENRAYRVFQTAGHKIRPSACVFDICLEIVRHRTLRFFDFGAIYGRALARVYQGPVHAHNRRSAVNMNTVRSHVNQVEKTLNLRLRILRRPLLSDEHSRVAGAVILTH